MVSRTIMFLPDQCLSSPQTSPAAPSAVPRESAPWTCAHWVTGVYGGVDAVACWLILCRPCQVAFPASRKVTYYFPWGTWDQGNMHHSDGWFPVAQELGRGRVCALGLLPGATAAPLAAFLALTPSSRLGASCTPVQPAWLGEVSTLTSKEHVPAAPQAANSHAAVPGPWPPQAGWHLAVMDRPGHPCAIDSTRQSLTKAPFLLEDHLECWQNATPGHPVSFEGFPSLTKMKR